VFTAALVFVYGLLIGSFLNAWIMRFKLGKSVARGRSACPHCNHQLATADLVPVASWLWLGGKCRYCGKPISRQYPAVELLTGLLFGLSFLALRPQGALSWLNFGVWLVILSCLIFLAVYDLKHLLLPDKILLPAIAVRALQIIILFALGGLTWNQTWPLVATALVCGAAFYAIVALSDGKWLGGGDIKLVFLLGLLLGPQLAPLGLFIAFNSAAVIGVALIALRKRGRRDVIAFGPFLIAGIIIAFLYGEAIMNWYLQVLGVA
jgi:prepilin signal peptidase PulO-like enzyme (type II secretory pathway)